MSGIQTPGQLALRAALLACSLSSVATAQTTCDVAFKDSISTRTIQAFDQVATVAPIWGKYSLGKHQLLLLADTTFRGHPETPACAAIWRAGHSLELLELHTRPKLLTPLYGMLNLDPPGPRAVEGGDKLLASWRQMISAKDAAKLASLGIRRAVILPVPLDFNVLGALGKVLSQMKADPARMQADLAVHESFHLHSQFPTWLDQRKSYPWPTWERQPSRAELRDRCYAGSSSVSAALAEELSALSAALDSLLDTPSPARVDGALANARRFVALRTERRQMLDTVTVAQEGHRISCALAEDIMELEEGSVQWLAQITTVRAGMLKLESLRGSFQKPQAEAFYQFGPMQLLVMGQLLSEKEMKRFVNAVGNAPGPDALLFQQFDRETARLTKQRQRSVRR